MSFQQGLSGLNATSKSLDVIGNNIANANTYGAKASRAEFSDVYAAALNGAGTSSIGIGTRIASVSQQFTQGNITTTENPMDLAINGAGFFQVSDGKSPTVYTRNGQFKVDSEGSIINNDKLKLMGYPAVNGVPQPGLAQPLQLPTDGIAPKSTTEAKLELNFDSRKKATLPFPAPTPQIKLNDPTTYNDATAQTVYDAKGQDVALTYYFQRVAPDPADPAPRDTWNVFVTANGLPLGPGTPAAPEPVATVSFDPSSGDTPQAMQAGAPVDMDKIQLTIPAGIVNAAGAAVVPTTMALDFSKATQYGANFGVTFQDQNGNAPGQLTNITIEPSGIVMARYSNGDSRAAGQVELATFRNPQGLQPMGGNIWARTFASGDPVVGTPSQGNMGVLQAGALEESNVDLTHELVDMITAQRIYQANAQTIKTQDQVMQTIVNLR